MANVKFYRGLKSKYSATLHADGLYFATDTHELIMNDKTFGNKSIASVVPSQAGGKLTAAISFTDGTSSNLTIGDNLLVASLLGTANGIATLGSDGKVPAAQLPSYVDDVIEAASFVDFPSEGESGKIYVALDTNLTYRWSGSAYVEISASLALGETASTAYAGDKGKANAEALAALRAEFDEKVGAFTIGVNVPENAEFTDTKVTEVGNHYIPSKSATKSAAGATATAGATVQVVTGIEVDAAGHITGIVSGAVKDTVFDPSALNEAVVWNDVN